MDQVWPWILIGISSPYKDLKFYILEAQNEGILSVIEAETLYVIEEMKVILHLKRWIWKGLFSYFAKVYLDKNS